MRDMFLTFCMYRCTMHCTMYRYRHSSCCDNATERDSNNLLELPVAGTTGWAAWWCTCWPDRGSCGTGCNCTLSHWFHFCKKDIKWNEPKYHFTWSCAAPHPALPWAVSWAQGMAPSWRWVCSRYTILQQQWTLVTIEDNHSCFTWIRAILILTLQSQPQHLLWSRDTPGGHRILNGCNFVSKSDTLQYLWSGLIRC